jgi:hypothetical protein
MNGFAYAAAVRPPKQTLRRAPRRREPQHHGVAKQGFEALMKGEKHVYSASWKTKLEGATANITPDAVKAAMHEKMAKPVTKDAT